MARAKLTDLYKNLSDTPLNEQMSPETLMVKLGGDEKTELKISNQTDSSGDIDLSNVTLEFKDKKYEGLEFKYEDDIEGGDHENEGKDVLFVAEAEDGTIFEVEVNAEAGFDMSGRIQDVEWRSLETFPSKEDQQGIEEEHLFMLEDEETLERKNVSSKGDSKCSHPDKECTKDSQCVGLYQGHCCQNGCCAQCVSYEKDPVKDKRLEESVITRLQKLANIKNETK